MKHWKKFVLIVSLILVFATAGFGGYKYFTKKETAKTNDDKAAVGEIPVDEKLVNYDETRSLVENKNWSEAMQATKKYAEDTTNPLPLRITAYANCAFAAQNAPNQAEQQECLKLGAALVATLPEADRAEAKNAFDALSNGKAYESDVPAEDIRD